MKKIFLSFLFWFLKKESLIILKRFNPEIIAITGSIAKSSTKEAIFAVLGSKYKDQIGKSYGNLNNEMGIPLSILGYRQTPELWMWPGIIFCGLFKALFISKYPKILVLELAADKPGDIEYLLSFIKPKIGVITTVGLTHLEQFKDIEGVEKEKSKLVSALPRDGKAFLNRFDKKVMAMAKKTKAKVIFYQGKNYNIFKEAAVAVGESFGINRTKAQKIIAKSKLLKGRMNLLQGVKKSKIIDDSYNSNPQSCSIALDYLAKSVSKRKVAILGEMLELGDFSQKAHQEIGDKAREIADLLILVGSEFKNYQKSDFWYPNSQRAISEIKKLIHFKDIILIKGSRKIKMELIVKELVR